MRLKITHKDNKTSVTDLDTGKSIGGVQSVSFDRYVGEAAKVSLTLIDTTGHDFEVDVEIAEAAKNEE